MIDRRYTGRPTGHIVAYWLASASIPAFIGLVVILAQPPALGTLAGLALVAVGVGAAVRILRVTTIVQQGQLTVRNLIRSTTFPVASIQAIEVDQSVELNLLRAFGLLVVTDGAGRRWKLSGTIGESPQIIRMLVHDLQEAAPGARVDVDLSRFPHDRARGRGTEHLGTSPTASPAPPTVDAAERERRRAAGRAQATHLKEELDRLHGSKHP